MHNFTIKKIFVFIILLAFWQNMNAAVNTNQFSSSTSTYAPLTGGIKYGSALSSVNSFANIPIGFTFKYDGNPYTVLGATNYGYIKLGAATGGSIFAVDHVFQNGTLTNVIAGFNAEFDLGFLTTGSILFGTNTITNINSLQGVQLGDIIDPSGTFFPANTTVTGKNSSNNTITLSANAISSNSFADILFDNGGITVQTIGVAPNRTCVIQWNNARKKLAYDETYNFQIRLSETTNSINIVYGNMNQLISNNNDVQVGLLGSTTADFLVRQVTTNWTTSAPGLVLSSICNINANLLPYSGLSFNYCVLPTLPVLTSNANPACINNIVTLAVLTGELNGASDWHWFTDSCNGPLVNTGANYIYPAPATNTVYYASGRGGCLSSVEPCATYSLNVFASTPMVVTTIPNPATVCNGDPITFSSTAPNAVWSGGVINNVSFIPTANTIYTLTSTNANGCIQTITQTVTINVSPNLLSIVSVPTNNIVCAGQSLQLTASGYSNITWTGGVVNGNSFIPAATTIYTVTGADGNGLCTATSTVLVTVNALPNVIANPIPATGLACSGLDFTLYGSGAVNYTWSNGITNNVPFVPLTNNIYTITGTDNFGCSKTNTYSLQLTTSPTITGTTIPATATGCIGYTVTLNGAGAGIGGTYTWSNSALNATSFQPTQSNIYTVTGLSANGCLGTSTVNVVVNQIPVITFTTSPASSSVCVGNSIVITALGANTYSWSPSFVVNGIGFTPTVTGVYTVTATGTGGCTKTATKVVQVLANPTLVLSTIPANASVCAGNSVVLNATGISNATWSGGIGNNVSFIPNATAVYTVSGTNASGCVGSATKLVTVNLLPNTGINVLPGIGVVCTGQSVTFLGTGASSYAYSPSATNNVSFVPVNSAIYTVTGTSAAGCVSTKTISITVNNLPSVSILNYTGNYSICPGELVLLNGQGAVAYTYSGSINDGVAFSPAATTTYTVTGTSANNCVSTSTITITLNALPITTINNTPSSNIICIGNPMILNATAPGSTITWTGGVTNNISFSPTVNATYTATVTNSAGCTVSSTVSIIVNPKPTLSVITTPANAILCTSSTINLNATSSGVFTWSGGISNNVPITMVQSGVYTVTSTSNLNCTSTQTVSVTVNPGATINISSTPSNFKVCNGLPILLNATGNASYNWSNGIQNNVGFSPTATANYTVTATTANGCSATSTVSVTVNSLPVITLNGVPANFTVCTGSTMVLTATGASTYAWSGGITNGVAFLPNTSSIFSLVATDTNGCIASESQAVSVLALPTVSITSLPTITTLCAGSPITLTGNGATTYTWANGNVNGQPFLVTSSSIYTVTGVTNGCSSTSTIAITALAQPAISVVSAPANAAVCYGQSITLSGAGGIAGNYTWSNNVPNGQAFLLTNSSVYTLTGVGTNGCTSSTTISVTVNANPTLSITSNPSNTNGAVICAGGLISVEATGAASIAWSNGIINNVNFSPTVTAVYTVTGTDNNGCVASSTYQISVNGLPTITITSIPNNTVYCANSNISLTATGANSFTWSNGVINGVSFPVTGTTIYTVTASNGTGCVTTATKLITVSSVTATITSNPTIPALCPNQALTLTGSGGNTYSWTSGVINGVSFTPTSPNIYTLTSTDGFSCTATKTIIVTINTGATLSIQTIPANGQVCVGKTMLINALSNVTNISISNGVVNNTAFNPTVNGVYTVSTTNGNGCSTSSTVVVTINALPVITATSNIANPICTGSNVILNGANAGIGGTYTWTGGISNNTGFILASAGVYTVTGSTVNGCTGTTAISLTILPGATIYIATIPSTFPICQGTMLTLSASGSGTNYTWNNAVTNGIPKASIANSPYIVTATSSNGCVITSVANITVSATPSATVSFLPFNATICRDQQLKVFVNCTTCTSSSITGPFSPAISTVTNLMPFYPQSNTIYTVTVVNGACSSTATTSCFVKPLPVFTITSNLNNNNACAAVPVTFTGSGANNTSYSYTGAVSNGVPFTPIGNNNSYTVTVTNTSTCTSTSALSINIVQFPILNATVAPSGITCPGQTVILNGSGAQTYSWSGGIFNNTPFAATTTTTYTLTGTNAGICSTTITKLVTVDAIQTPVVTAIPSFTVCAGQQVSVNASVQSGVTYSWSNSIVANSSFIPVANTVYTLTATSTNGCIKTRTFIFTINSIPTITIASNPANASICEGTSVTLSASGADTYLWSNNNAVANVISVVPTASTVYTVVGTDVLGCSSTKTVSINVNLKPVISFTSIPASGNVCIGQSISLNATTNSGTLIATPVFANNSNFVLASNTIYTVTATGTNGCTISTTKLVTTSALPTINTITNQIVCTGSSITVNAISPNNTISWNNGTTVVNGNPLVTILTSSSIYTVTATNLGGCTVSTTFAAIAHIFPVINITSSPSNNVVCAGLVSTLTSTGGNVLGWQSNNVPVSNGIGFVPTATSTYTVSVANSYNYCTLTATVTMTVSALPNITVSPIPANGIVCSGSPMIINATSPGNSITILGALNPIVGVPFYPTASGAYSIKSTNINGCTTTNSLSITVNTSPVVSITSNNTSADICAGSNVQLKGNGALTYLWLHNNSTIDSCIVSPIISTVYTVVGTSANSCTSSSLISLNSILLPTLSATINPASGGVCLGSPATISALSNANITISNNLVNNTAFTPSVNGVYTITATNISGCTTTSTISVSILAKPTPTITANPFNSIVCIGSVYTFTASGGNSYSWSGSTITGAIITPTMVTSLVYTVTATAVNGCVSTATKIAYAKSLPVVGITATPANGIVCAGQQAKLVASGGSTYSWSSIPTITQNVLFTPATTATYTVSAIGSTGCIKTKSTTVIVSVPSPISVTTIPSSAMFCAGTPLTINATVASGTLSIAGLGNPSIGVQFIPSASAIYTITNTNSNGCQTNTTLSVIVNPLPSIAIASSNSSTSICALNSVKLTASGANTYNWTNNGVITDSQTVNPTISTIYTVVGSDNNGCTKSATNLINVVSLPNLITSILPASGNVCLNDAVTISAVTDVNSTLSISGGVALGITFNAIASTIYTVTATNFMGCSITSTLSITVNTLPIVSIAMLPNVSNVCLNSGVTLTATGAASYAWSGGITNGVMFPTSNLNSYTVTGTSANGCTATTMISYNVLPLPTVSITAFNPNTSLPAGTVCINKTITLTASGNASSYVWLPSFNNGTPINIAYSKVYTVTATGANGCTAKNNYSVTASTPNPIVSAGIPVGGNLCQGTLAKWTSSSAGSNVAIAGLFGVNLTANGYYPQATSFYTITATNTLGCTLTKLVYLAIKPAPIITVTPLPSYTICNGTPLNLTATGASTYTWSGGLTNGNYFVPSNSLSYSVIGTGTNGCIAAVVVNTVVNPLPTITIAPYTNPVNIVAGVNNGVNLCATISSGASIIWSNSVANCTLFYPSQTATYTATVTSAAGCVTTASATVTVVITPGNLVDNLDDSPITNLTGAHLAPDNLINWQLDAAANVDEIQISRGTTKQNLEVIETMAQQQTTDYKYVDKNVEANYYYQITTLKNNQRVNSNVVFIPKSSSLSLYPNPVVGNDFNVSLFATKADDNAIVRVYNMEGKLVHIVNTQLEMGTTTINIDASKLTAGNYTLQVQANNIVIGSAKFIKQ